ncbi:MULTISPECIES: calcium-binding protein [Kamptonema]|uniref:calcium-binding protein n=1 Tax=Kamptonema TaxID=1501433 RepID=UPI0001DACEC0|nr:MULTISPECIES: hypothetical protein [Kamptonema]CBN55088.1 hypothetical protein OSCI_1480024 [Kamptonema sp. PCC 6506]
MATLFPNLTNAPGDNTITQSQIPPNPNPQNPPQNQTPPNPNPPNPPQNQTPPTPPTPPANSISTTSGNDNITGDASDNFILGGTGSDTLSGGESTDTVSYLSLNSAITLQAGGIVNKGAAGNDILDTIEQIIAPLGQINTLDASTGSGVASINVDLSTNSVAVNNLPGIGTLNLTVENFVNVVGTPNVDVITGNRQNNNLVGGAGNDTLSGLRGNDTLIGVDLSSATPGSNETDVLIGGQGRDTFVLGDATNTYYQGAGVTFIQDFQQNRDVIQLHGQLSDYTIVGNSINLAGTSDQIAVIQGNFTTDNFVFV